MSKLEELVQRLCPNGVEYKRLGDVLVIKNGRDYKSFKSGNVPVYGSGGIMAYIDTAVYDKPSVLIPRKGSLEKLYYVDKPFWNVDTIFYTEINTELVCPKFVYYWLAKQHLERLNKAGGVPSLTQAVLNKIIIPVPPLEIQREIVRILDRFTELSTELSKELTAELAAREKQFQFYRKQFFEFKKSDCVQIVCIKDICELLTGYPFDSSQFAATGINLLRGMNIKRGILDYSESNNRYWNSVQGYEKFLLSIDDIVIAMDGSLVGKSYAQVKSNHLPSLLVQRVARVRVTKANAHYVYHYISSGTFTRYVEKKKTGGAVPHITLKDIANFKIPLPSENMQKEISDSLDHFNALCNDLTSGLPAEIAARQKQYEYYRDKLLTFNSKEIL